LEGMNLAHAEAERNSNAAVIYMKNPLKELIIRIFQAFLLITRIGEI